MDRSLPMQTRLLIVFATSIESEILKKIGGTVSSDGSYLIGNKIISSLVTGVGGISTAWAMKQWLCQNPCPDLAINVGIAGSYSDKIKIGDVVMPITDCFADMGIETGEKIITLAEAGLTDPDKFPFEQGIIRADNKFVNAAGKIFKTVRGITVNTCSGSKVTIERLRKKFNPDIETMEGATFFYICALEKIPFLSVRAISNRVEPGNRNSWNIQLALDNLEGKLKELLLMME
jgi:futalosine hydrolase